MQMIDAGAAAHFDAEGFLHVPGGLGADALAQVSGWIDALAAAPEVSGGVWKYHEAGEGTGPRLLSRIENFVPHHDGLAAFLTEGALPAAVAALFGEGAILFKDKVNFKLPGGAGFEPHQDVQAGWSAYGRRHISVLVALDPMTVENGCLEVMPAAHRNGLLGRLWEPLTEAETPSAAYRPVPCAAGDLLFFDSFLPHRSAPNRTDRPRRALYVTYNAQSDGDQRTRYYADKYRNHPPDIDRDPDKRYAYKV